MKILLIDDDLPCINNLKDALEPGGHECVLFQNPNEGIAAFQSDNFDVVVTDYKMPVMNGLDVLRTIREHNPETYIIIVTGFADTNNAIAAVNDGAYAFFRKPLDFNRFMKTIGKIEEELHVAKEIDGFLNQILTGFNKVEKNFEESKNNHAHLERK